MCIDTLRADHVGAYGYRRATTPRLDALADEGVLFTDAYAQSSWTVPATASLFTGLYPSEHGAGMEGDDRHLDGEAPVLQIRPGVQTLADLLGDAGLRTGLFSANPFLYGRFTAGFEEAQVERRNAEALTTDALAWLDLVKGERFFLYVQYMDLHQPIEPPSPYFEMFPAGGSAGAREARHGGWSYGELRTEEDLRDPGFLSYRAHRTALYDGALRYVDDQVGRLLGRLEELGLAETTLIVVTSDHGEEFWDHAVEQSRLGEDPRGFWGVGHGHSMYEEVLRIPWILAGPRVPSGRRSRCIARHIDLVATSLELLGLPPAPWTSGRSLVEEFSGEEECREVPVLAESPAYGPDSRTVIWKGRKLIVRSDGVELLFDLRRDPEERDDLTRERPRLASALHEILEREVAGTRDLNEPMALPIDEETKRELRALGYIQ